MNDESEESFTERDEDSRKEQCYIVVGLEPMHLTVPHNHESDSLSQLWLQSCEQNGKKHEKFNS